MHQVVKWIGTGAALALLAGCGTSGLLGPRLSPKECLKRVMYFESNRSSRDGMIAVGSVVMNRVQSGKYPKTICGVVGQKNQFAAGVLSKPMRDRGAGLADEAAKAVLGGERHPMIGQAMFFHTAGLRFPYNNMHYVLTAGGNSFYEKRKAAEVSQPVPPPPTEGITGKRGWLW